MLRVKVIAGVGRGPGNSLPIGKHGDIPWRSAADLAFFKAATYGQHGGNGRKDVREPSLGFPPRGDRTS